MPSSLVHKIRIGKAALFDRFPGAAGAVLSGYRLGGKPVVLLKKSIQLAGEHGNDRPLG
jgi:hypothetical protein